MDCSRTIHAQVLKKVAIPLKIVAVFEPSENSCRSSEKSGHFSEEKKIVCAFFGETMENVRDRIEIKTAFDDKYFYKYVSKPNFHSSKVLVDDNMVLMILNKKIVQSNIPTYAGFSILELSKYHMYDFHYNTMKPRYNENIELLMTDTDSLVYCIHTEDFYKDIYEMKMHLI